MNAITTKIDYKQHLNKQICINNYGKERNNRLKLGWFPNHS